MREKYLSKKFGVNEGGEGNWLKGAYFRELTVYVLSSLKLMLGRINGKQPCMLYGNTFHGRLQSSAQKLSNDSLLSFQCNTCDLGLFVVSEQLHYYLHYYFLSLFQALALCVKVRSFETVNNE